MKKQVDASSYTTSRGTTYLALRVSRLTAKVKVF
jgi:hypothetical protein